MDIALSASAPDSAGAAGCAASHGGHDIDPTLSLILLTTAIAGVLSSCGAALAACCWLPPALERMLGLVAGILLAAALLHALPQAFQGADPHALSSTLLAGLLSFFLLEKIMRVRRASQRASASGQPWCLILVGAGLHNAAGGALVAAAFAASPQLGASAALALAVHKLPLDLATFLILLDGGLRRGRALATVLLCALIGVAGAALAFVMLQHSMRLLPYVLVLAASGLMYIVLSEMLPRMQRSASVRESLPQVALIAFGISAVLYLSGTTR